MFTVTHLAVGGALGGCVQSGWLAFALGVASHVVLDAVPHYDIDDFRVDVALTAVGAAGLVALGYWRTPAFWGALGAVVPDVEILLWKLGVLRDGQQIFPSHTRVIRHGRRLSSAGLIPQVVLLLGAAGWLIFLRS